MNLETVFRTYNEPDALIVRSRLEAADIEAYIAHDLACSAVGGTIPAGGLLVQVPEDQAEDARALIAAKD
jgi:hypothetical protein